MVRIVKPIKRNDVAIYKKMAASIALSLLVWIAARWFSTLVSVIIEGGSKRSNSGDGRLDRKVESYPQSGKIATQQIQSSILRQQQAKSTFLNQLEEVSTILPLSPPSLSSKNPGGDKDSDAERKFLAAVRKECIPGRDDSGGEINPTTHRKRECLRHVPLGKVRDGWDLEKRMKRQKPRIAIMIPPGYIGRVFADWIADALKSTRDNIHMEIEILITSHVPVYGYGKSHGFTKIIRLLTLPLPLAVYDMYLFAYSETIDGVSHSLHDVVNEMKLGGSSLAPSASIIGSIVELIMRWHCRLSHVSAHTAMITVSLEDIVKNPVESLASVLGFVWREDWEWEGQGGNHNPGIPPRRGWNHEAQNLLLPLENGGHGGAGSQRLLMEASLILHETAAFAYGNTASQKAVQGAFSSEMKRSSDMSAWPCPSFWDGVQQSTSDVHGNDNQIQILHRISSQMVPNCNDDEPFVRCTVNKDRCEVKEDAKCK